MRLKALTLLTIGVLFIGAAPYLARSLGSPMPFLNGFMGPNESPGRLYPACDYYPDGLNGKPCADSKEHERTGQLVFYDHYPDKRSSFVPPR